MYFSYIHTGSIKVDFEVEAPGSDASSLAALENSTTALKGDLESGGVSLKIGNLNLTAPTQNVTVATVDVTPAVILTYNFTFKVI